MVWEWGPLAVAAYPWDPSGGSPPGGGRKLSEYRGLAFVKEFTDMAHPAGPNRRRAPEGFASRSRPLG